MFNGNFNVMCPMRNLDGTLVIREGRVTLHLHCDITGRPAPVIRRGASVRNKTEQGVKKELVGFMRKHGCVYTY